MKLHALALAYASAIFCGLWAFLIMAFSLLTGKAGDLMARAATLHWASYSWSGAILMLVEHAIGGFVLGWIFAWLYNKFAKSNNN